MHSVRSVALAIGAPAKWVDNALSHHRIPGVSRRARGVQRDLDGTSVLILALTRFLAVDLGVPIALGSKIAGEIAGTVDESAVLHRRALPSGLVLEVPVAAIVRQTRERLVDAAEAVAHIKRGRPPTRDRGA